MTKHPLALGTRRRSYSNRRTNPCHRGKRMKSVTRIGAVVALVLLPGVALAHPGHGDAGFAHGFAHPLSGLDHLLAMVAVGLYAALLGGRALWLVPASFVTMMTVGGAT